MKKLCKNCAHCRAREAFPGHIVHDCLVKDCNTTLACTCENWDERGASVLEGVKWQQEANGDKDARDAHERSLWKPNIGAAHIEYEEYPVLDACCGARLMWYDKADSRILAQDIRSVKVTCMDRQKQRTVFVTPDVIGDFRKMSFKDNTFSLVMFDPPHLLRAGESSWLFKKYGKLEAVRWADDLSAGFRECMRVLRPLGTLVFKWNSCQLSIDKVKKCFPCEPVFMSRQGKTYFYVFMKGEQA